MTITTPKDTYNYIEFLVNEELNKMLESAARVSASGEALATLREDLRVLYKHLENVQKMRAAYIMGR
jgi:hypothetical protein